MDCTRGTRVLFILKQREDYNNDASYSAQGVSTGLWNSAHFVSDMLNQHEIVSEVVQVIDNNGIDKQVSLFKPTHVIIEALWVVPSKFDILSKLHPTVKWIIRLHSEMPFLAGEGIGMKWISEYTVNPNVSISCNSARMNRQVRFFLAQEYPHRTKKQIAAQVVYLPNYYMPVHSSCGVKSTHPDELHVGCFGAIRPMKNQLLQAVAALEYAVSRGKKLHFHINIGRVESRGEPALRNLTDMFAALVEAGHVLHLHQWIPHDQFVEIVKTMDIGMQVSFSETFNIVTADMVAHNIPVVTSHEIAWIAGFHADSTSTEDIVCKMGFAHRFAWLFSYLNKRSLTDYSRKSAKTWINYFCS